MTRRRSTAYAMCGLSFSGKSTLAGRIAEALDLAVVSLDAINDERGFRGGEVIDDDEWERTSHIAMERLAGHLREGRSAVVDDTFSHRFLRERCRAVAQGEGAGFAVIYVETPLDVIEARRAENARTGARMAVTDAVFYDHRDRFQHPDPDEPVVRIASEEDLRRFLARERDGA